MPLKDFLATRFRPSELHDGLVKVVPANYGQFGSYPKYDWNMPRTGSQPTLMGYPPHQPRWNKLFAIDYLGRTTPGDQYQGYLVQVKTYGEPMVYPTQTIASLKGL